MRTTINISDARLAEANLLAANTNRPLGCIVDDALRHDGRDTRHNMLCSAVWTGTRGSVGGRL